MNYKTDYRSRIKDIFREMAATRGFYGVTVDELAARAGISKRTIYRYFRNKEEIINSVVDDFISSVEQKVGQVVGASGAPPEKIARLITMVTENINFFHPLVLHDLQKYYPCLWKKIERFRAENIQQVFEKLILDGEQEYFTKIDPKVFTAVLIAGVQAVLNPAFIMENNLSLKETMRAVFSIYLYGLLR